MDFTDISYHKMIDRETKLEQDLAALRNRLAAGDLKLCPLCRSLNASKNVECFVCRWKGHFEQDTAAIQRGLSDFLARCPEFGEHFTQEPTAAKIGLWRRLRAVLAIFRRRLDFRA